MFEKVNSSRIHVVLGGKTKRNVNGIFVRLIEFASSLEQTNQLKTFIYDIFIIKSYLRIKLVSYLLRTSSLILVISSKSASLTLFKSFRLFLEIDLTNTSRRSCLKLKIKIIYFVII